MGTPPRRRLGRTDLQVFPLNLGGNVFGWTADRERSFAVLDAYRAAGGNFIDTADVYSKWVPGHRGGESEEVIGAWLRARRCRDEVVVATKVGLGGPDLEPGLSADQIRRGCEGSLRRLGVERIDLFYAHRDDERAPLEETLQALDALTREGKVRHLGASNYAAPRLAAALDLAARGGLASYAVLQPEYNLVARAGFEAELAPLCAARGLGVCAYFALGAGFLTGKYRREEPPQGPRAARVQGYAADPRAWAVLDAARDVAARRGATVAQVALAWLLHQPALTTPLASATSVAQLEELLGALALRLAPEELAALSAAGEVRT